jgi:hypothetical protein
MTTPYALTPVGPAGQQPERTEVVYGPRLKDSATRAEPARQIGRLLADNDRLIRELDEARGKAASFDRIAELWEESEANRLKAQHRLSHAMRVLAVISKLYPPLRPVIDRARKDIWGTDG